MLDVITLFVVSENINNFYLCIYVLLSRSSHCIKKKKKKTTPNQFCSESRLQSFVLYFVYIWIKTVCLMSEINVVTEAWIRSKIPSKHSSAIINAVINNPTTREQLKYVAICDFPWSNRQILTRSHPLSGCLADNGCIVFGFISKSRHLFYFWKTFYVGVNHAWEYWCQCLRWSGHW